MRIFDIKLRTVDVNDAEFILELRNDERKKRFISETTTSVEDQKKWISAYKEREKAGEELYFIGSDKDNIDFGLYRIYKIKTGLPEIGSWVTKPGYNNIINPIKLDVAIKGYVFNDLNFDKLQFEVRKLNSSVIKYHYLFKPVQVGEDELNYYYNLNKTQFEEIKPKLLYKFKISAL